MNLISRVLPLMAVTALAMTPAAGSAKALHSLDEGLAQAKETGKPVLIDFFATWCGPCKAFDKASHEDAKVMAALEDFILVKYDAEKGEGKELAELYSIRGYPTYVAANAEGEVLDRWAGYSQESFVERTTAITGDPTTLAEKRVRYEASPNLKDAETLARAHDSKGEYLEALAYYRSAAELGDEPHAFEIFYATYLGVRSKQLQEPELIKTADGVFAADVPENELLASARMMWSYGEGTDQREMGLAYLKTAVERTKDSTNPGTQTVLAQVMPTYALHVDKDEAKAIALKKQSLGDGWETDPSSLNSFAWWCFENRINLEEAQTIAERGAELAAPGGDRAQILDTVAEICNAREDCSNAVAWMKQAVAEAPENDYYKKQLARFEELLAQQQK